MASDDTYCQGEATLSCFIPMKDLTDPTGKYKLPLNRFIQARVRAVNFLGISLWSDLNTDQASAEVAFAKTIPADPELAPIRNPDPATIATDSISIIMPEITDFSE